MLRLTAGTRVFVPVEGHLYDVLHNAGALVQLATAIRVFPSGTYERDADGRLITWPVFGLYDGTGDWLEVEIADLAAIAEAEWAAERAAYEDRIRAHAA